MQMVAPALVLFSVLFPTKLWFAPDQPLTVTVKPSGGAVALVLTDFLGKVIERARRGRRGRGEND